MAKTKSVHVNDDLNCFIIAQAMAVHLHPVGIKETQNPGGSHRISDGIRDSHKAQCKRKPQARPSAIPQTRPGFWSIRCVSITCWPVWKISYHQQQRMGVPQCYALASRQQSINANSLQLSHIALSGLQNYFEWHTPQPDWYQAPMGAGQRNHVGRCQKPNADGAPRPSHSRG